MRRIKTEPKAIRLTDQLRNELIQTYGSGLMEQQKFYSRLKPHNIMHRIQTPKNFNSSSIGDFLKNVEFLFFLEKKLLPPIQFTLKKTKKSSLLGLLLTYKIMSYSAQKDLFQLPFFYSPGSLTDQFSKTGIYSIINEHLVNNKFPEKPNILHKLLEENLFIYPKRIKRGSTLTCQEMRACFIAEISDFYEAKNNHKATRLISSCVSEIISNFWAHAKGDTETVIAARGTKESFTLVVIDNGEGFISSLGKVYKKSPPEILRMSLNQEVTSKLNTDHMGYGLYHVYELIKANEGTINVWTEGYHMSGSSKDIKITECGHWKGAIVEIKLGLQKPKTLADVFPESSRDPKIKINFRD